MQKKLTIEVYQNEDGKLKIELDTNFVYHEVIGVLDLIKFDIHKRTTMTNEAKETIEDIQDEMICDKWAQKLKRDSKISTRLYNFLTDQKKLATTPIDKVTKIEFLKYRGCGEHYWNEFVKHRGY